MIDIPLDVRASLSPRYQRKVDFTASDVDQIERTEAKRIWKQLRRTKIHRSETHRSLDVRHSR